MEAAGRPLKLPTINQIIGLNRKHIRQTGGLWAGSDNLKNRGSLEWVLNAIRYPLFGVDQYPTITQKVAVIAWTIITRHVFHDGNKRTAMSALEYTLRSNSYNIDVTYDEMEEVALRIATIGELDNPYSEEEFLDWINNGLVIYPRYDES